MGELSSRDREIIGQQGRLVMLAVYKCAAYIAVGIAALLVVDQQWRAALGIAWCGLGVCWFLFRIYDLTRAYKLTDRAIDQM